MDHVFGIIATDSSSFFMDRVHALLSQEKYYYSHILIHQKRELSLGIRILDLYRDRLCQWLYSVVDYYNFDRDIVALTINIIERYCLSSQSSVTMDDKEEVKSMIQLVTLSSLYIVLKVSCQKTIEFDSFLSLGRDEFTKDQIETMEMTILDVVEWRISIPTTKLFTSHFLVLLRKVLFPAVIQNDEEDDEKEDEEEYSFSRSQRAIMHEIRCTSFFLGELSICDSYYNDEGILPSTVAVASVLYAMRLSSISQSLIYKTQSLIFQAIDMETECKNELDMCIARLCESYSLGKYESQSCFARESSPTHVGEFYVSE